MNRHPTPIARALPSPRSLRPLRSILLALLAAGAAHAQDLTIKAPPQAGPLTIWNATIHTVSGQTLDKGFIAFDRGVIREVGSGNPHVPGGELGKSFIDAKGAHVYPGLIGADTNLDRRAHV